MGFFSFTIDTKMGSVFKVAKKRIMIVIVIFIIFDFKTKGVCLFLTNRKNSLVITSLVENLDVPFQNYYPLLNDSES